jgi:hypothetical protein
LQPSRGVRTALRRVTPALEALADPFGAFEAIAESSIKLVHYAAEDELVTHHPVTEAVLEFGADLRAAAAGARVVRGTAGNGEAVE